MSVQNHRDLLAKANQFVAAAAPRVERDRFRLQYHFMSPAYWMNDPNGFSFINGQYHLFYQHYPYNAASTFAFKYWGHAVSDDLVLWKQLPIAIAPSEEYDLGGCWSGCAVDDDGKLTLIYTGHVDERSPKEVQAIAISEDGVNFEKYAGNPVVASPPAEASEDFRDPKVWRHDGNWYMMVGTGKDGIGKVVLYRSINLLDWTYIGVMAESDGTQGHMWECPDFFHLDGKDVLIISPIGMKSHKNIAIIGRMEYDTGKFKQEILQELDYGPDFYAAATTGDDRGRRILIAWMDMWGNPMPTVERDWAGAMTIPRVLSLSDEGCVISTPLPELASLRGEHFGSGAKILSEDTSYFTNEVLGESLEIIAEFQFSSSEGASGSPFSTQFGLKVRCSADGKEQTLIEVLPSEGRIVLDTAHSGAGLKAQSSAPIQMKENGVMKLHVFVDRSSIEVFANGGEAAISSRIYPSEGSVGISAFASHGTVTLKNLDIWKLNDNEGL